ncbi:Serine/threonine protein kinase [Streptomyces zhaozhouensis]|uniref:Serine/threonine-protein kinase AfsK n=1 Tax=Streptomyces zhaozhouensis TaxID=1300267 RepID=A0A286DY61_9ACTN|nr:PQQ-binding-like beta-propeller repeat protein [Streptomyces zhaozhouensis]SOD63598.1 Serine/threonine protein kinase [Streptomyces zhaozhouensis]
MVGQLTQHDPRRIGPFEVLGRLGAGGMGLVYLARSASGRRVAIKTVRSELAEDQLFRVRFTREVEAARAVSGFYTAAVVDADPRAAVPWLATAYVPAPSLEEIVTDCGPLPAQSVRWLAAGIAEALQSIHGAGLVHRDLKPSNVLVVEDGPRVIDFGIASGVSNTRLTMTNVAVGTPAYMSPEQAKDSRSVNGASDVFSLASTLVFAATGHPPYHGGNPVETVFMLLRERPDLAGLPDELRPLIESLMEHKPEDRPSPADLQAQLAPYLFAAGDDGGSASAWLPPDAVAMIEARRGRPGGAPRQQPWSGADAPPPPGPTGGQAPPSPPPPSQARPEPQSSGAAPRSYAPPMPSMPPPPPPSTPPPSTHDSPPTGPPVVRQPSGAAQPPPPAAEQRRQQPQEWGRPPTAHQQAAVPSPNTAHPGQMHQSGATADHAAGGQEAGGQEAGAAPRWRPWRFRMSNDLWGSPTVYGGALYVTSLEVHALDVASGRRRFRTREVAWSMAVDGGLVLASDGPSLFALDASDGTDRWRVGTDGWIYGLRAERGTVLTASRGGLVTAWEAGTGEQLWELTGGQSDFETQDAVPVMRDGVVYAWGEGQLYVLQARTGAELWRYPVGDTSVTGGVPVRVTPADDGTVYVCAGSRVLALDAASGAERWRFDAPAAILCSPTYQPAGGRDAGVYFTDYLGTVYALDLATGDDRWRIATEARQSTEPVLVSDGLVHLGSGTAMYTLDAVSGTPRWRFAAGESIVGAPVVRDGRLHFGSEDHCLYTLDAVSGRLSWKLETGGAITGTPAAANGMVFACSKDHCVYALDAARGTRQS